MRMAAEQVIRPGLQQRAQVTGHVPVSYCDALLGQCHFAAPFETGSLYLGDGAAPPGNRRRCFRIQNNSAVGCTRKQSPAQLCHRNGPALPRLPRAVSRRRLACVPIGRACPRECRFAFLVQSPKSKVQTIQIQMIDLKPGPCQLWTLDFGLWTLDFGLWTLDFY